MFQSNKNHRRLGFGLKTLILSQILSLFFNTQVYADTNSNNVTINTNFSGNVATDNWNIANPDVSCDIKVKNQGAEDAHVTLNLWEYLETSSASYIYTDRRYLIDINGNYIYFNSEAEAREAYPNNNVTYLTDAINKNTAWYIETKEDDPNGTYGKHVVLDKTLTTITIVGTTKGDVSTYVQRSVFDETPAADYIQWNIGNDVILESDWNKEPVAKWILLDNSSPGSFKWGQVLKAGEETSSLLESVRLMMQPPYSEGLYYEIYAAMDVVPIKTLSIYKFIEGNAANANDEFTFTVTLEDASGIPITGSYTYIGAGGANSGTLISGDTVKLKSNQNITILDLPIQTHYKIVENEANKNGYTTVSQSDEGLVGGSIDFDSKNLIFTGEPLLSPRELSHQTIANKLDVNTIADKAVAIFINTKITTVLPPIEPERHKPTPLPRRESWTFPENQVPLAPEVLNIPEEPVPLAPSPNPSTGRSDYEISIFFIGICLSVSGLLIKPINKKS